MVKFSLGIFHLTISLPWKSLGVLFILIVLTIISFVYMVRIRRSRVVKFGNIETLKKVEGKNRFYISPFLLFLKIFLIILIFLIATNSIKLNIVKPIPNAAVAILFDNSQSMLSTDYDPNRLDVAKNFISELASEMPSHTDTWVIRFSSTPTRIVGPTQSARDVSEAIDSISQFVSSDVGGGVANSLIYAADELESVDKENKMIILVTDSRNQQLTNISLAIDRLNQGKIKVHVIAVDPGPGYEDYLQQAIDIIQSAGLNVSIEEVKLDPELLGQYGISIYLPSNELYLPELTDLTQATAGNLYLLSQVYDSPDSANELFKDIVYKTNQIRLNSDYYILLFISMLLIFEVLLNALYGVI